MRTIGEDNELYIPLIDLINSIGNEINLRDEDKVLMLFHLNTEEKIFTFNRWVGERIKEDGTIDSTPKEIMHQTAVISRMEI